MLLRTGDEPIPGYQLERFLGKGQFGQVWQAKSPGRASVALKFLDLSGKQGRKEFRAIQRVKQIRHAHLMPIIALWMLDEEGNLLTDKALEGISEESSIADTLTVELPDSDAQRPATLVVAQLLGDKTLGDRLQECVEAGEPGIPPKELLMYMEEAARGIDFLNLGQHDLGDGLSSIQHCDIKPANILLLGDSVLVTDYGLARVLGDGGRKSRATSMVGSPAYMAPECISLKPSSASDQYSLAVSYVELRTGKLPFHSETFAEVLDSHRFGRLDYSRLTPAERKVIQKATAVKPENRFKSATEMVEELRRAALGGPTKGRTRQIATLIIASVAAVVALVTLATTFLFPPAPTPAPTKRYQIQVTPTDAQLVLDDVTQTMAADGKYGLERPPNSDLLIVAQKAPEFIEFRQTFSLSGITEDQPIRIEMQPNTEHYRAVGLQEFYAGNLTSAVDSYAIAIRADKTHELRRTDRINHYGFTEDGPINQSTITPDRRRLVTVGGKGAVRVWPLDTPTPGSDSVVVATLETSQASLEAISTNRWSVIADEGQALIVDLNPETGSPSVRRLAFPLGPVMAAISPDERWLVTVSQSEIDEGAATESATNEVRLHRWDLRADDLAMSSVELGTHGEFVDCITISSDGKDVYVGSFDATVLRYAIDKAEQHGSVIATHTGEIKSVVATDRYIAVAGAGTLAQASNATEDEEEGLHRATLIRSKEPPRSLITGHQSTIEFMGTDGPHRWLLTAAEGDSPQLWDTDAPETTPIILSSHSTSVVQTISFAPDGQWLALGSHDGTVELWDFQLAGHLTPLRLTNSMRQITSVAISADARWLVVCGADGVSIWDYAHCVLVKRACERLGIPLDKAPVQDDDEGPTVEA